MDDTMQTNVHTHRQNQVCGDCHEAPFRIIDKYAAALQQVPLKEDEGDLLSGTCIPAGDLLDATVLTSHGYNQVGTYQNIGYI
jgi:hypothetical protein